MSQPRETDPYGIGLDEDDAAELRAWIEKGYGPPTEEQ